MARAAPCTRPERTPRVRSSITWRSSIKPDSRFAVQRTENRGQRTAQRKAAAPAVARSYGVAGGRFCSSQFAKPAISPCRLMQPEYVSDPQISGPDVVGVVLLWLEASRFWSG